MRLRWSVLSSVATVIVALLLAGAHRLPASGNTLQEPPPFRDYTLPPMNPDGSPSGECPVRRLPQRIERPAVTVPVLIYHHFAPAELGLHRNNGMVIPPELFAQQMDWLQTQGYYTPSLDEFQAFLEGKLALPERSVLLTFDDGYESNLKYAHPVLCRNGFRAVLFAVGGFTPTQEALFNPAVLTYLSWQQMREMQESGVWEIANHTYSGHVKVNGVAPMIAWNQEQIMADTERLNRKWQEEGLPVPTAIAYPFGEYDAETVEALHAVGLRLGFTVQEGRVRPGADPLQLPRIGIFPYTDLEGFKRAVTPRL